MKKTLALVLALAMVFSTITVAFAEDTLGEDAQTCADLGMLKGESGTVDAAYVATAPTRLQAAVMFLRLKGLEAEALAFTGEDNFADGNIAWAEGANLIAYLKANPQLGWVGDGTNFNPTAPMTAQQYYKVLLEALGYKQTTAEVAGDFTYEEVFTFAASVGLSKVADVANFTVNDLAIATVEALKVNVKDTEKTLAATLVEAGKIDEAKAAAAGLVETVAPAVEVAIDEVLAIGNAVVQVVFEEDVDEASAGSIDNYAIEGVTIEEAVVAGPDSVRLYTESLTAGKLYTLTMGEQSVKFSGIAKVSDAPKILDIESEDVEEVVVEFDRNVDFATATDVATYDIKGITVVSAEIDPDEPDEVILTTEGLKDNTDYTLKVTNIKSIDLVTRKTTSDSFETDYDVAAPKIKEAKADTNERVIVTFNEEVSKESAEDLANYVIRVDETDGAELEIISIEWDDDDEDNVEIVTESMDKKEDYKITISNIADQRKVANVMTRAYSKTFDSIGVDDDAPKYVSPVKVLSPTKFMVEFSDDSRLDAASVLDVSNYELESDGSALDIDSIEEYDSDTGYFKAIFTVEELTSKKSVLTIVDVVDEFGNAMDEKEATFYAKEDSFASAKLKSAFATAKDTVILTFDGILDEDSAENIANYSIDGDIGTPTKAEYEYKVSGEKQKDKVRLTVNELVDGKNYDLTIDGLKDLAGNELVMDDITIGYKEHWDKDVKLDDADAINKYVVALSFDEEVKYAAGAYIILTENEGEDGDDPGAIKLYAKAMNEDDTVVEFSDYGNEVLSTESDVTYHVYYVNGVTNKANTKIAYEPYAFTFNASDSDDPEYAEFDSIEQIDADTVKVVMSRNVKVKEDIHEGFDVVVDGDKDYDETVYFRIRTGNIVEEHEYTLNLFECLTDEHGIPATDDDDVTYETDKEEANYLAPITGNTKFEGDDEDDSKPEIEDVVALDRLHIEVTFDEYITDALTKGNFEIVNIDDDDDDMGIDTVTLKKDDKFENAVVIIKLKDGEPLQGRYEYELRIKAGAVTDFANNKADADDYTFDGTNLAQYKDTADHNK